MHKQARAVVMLSKVRHYVLQNKLNNIYYFILESHLRYGFQIWFLYISKFFKDKIEKLQKRHYIILCLSLISDTNFRLCLKNGKSLKSKTLYICLPPILDGNLPTSSKTFFKDIVIYIMLLQNLASLNQYTCRVLKV